MATIVRTKEDAFKIVEDILDGVDVNAVGRELSVYGSFDLSDPLEIRRKKAVQSIVDRFKVLVMRFNALNENRPILSEFVEESQFSANKVKVDLIDACFNRLLDYKLMLKRFFESRPSKEGWSSIISELSGMSMETKARVMWNKADGKIYWKW